MGEERSSIINVMIFDKRRSSLVRNFIIINDIELAEQIFIRECKENLSKDMSKRVQQKAEAALDDGYDEDDNIVVYINWPEVETKEDQVTHEILDTTTVHDGYDHNEEPCKYIVVERDGKLVSINGHKMYKLPVKWNGNVSYNHCYICDREIKNKTNDLYWWTDGSHLCRDMSPFYFTNGGGCMDILIGKDCQKKHGLTE